MRAPAELLKHAASLDATAKPRYQILNAFSLTLSDFQETYTTFPAYVLRVLRAAR